MAFDAELLYEIEAEYEELRQKNAMDLENRKRAVFKKVPRLEEIDSEIKTLGLKLYKIAISGGDVKPQIDELRASQKKLLTVKKALLLENGYSEDELSERHNCDICKDTGSVDAKSCVCFKKKLIEKAYEQSNLSAQLTHQSFDTFDMSLYSDEVDERYGVSPKDHIGRIVKICKDFVADFDNSNITLDDVTVDGYKTFKLDQATEVEIILVACAGAEIDVNAYPCLVSGDEPGEFFE